MEGWLVLLQLGIIVLWGYIAYSVYVDAEKRGLPAVPWAIAVFLTGLIVLLIYHLIARNYPVRNQGDFGFSRSGFSQSGQNTGTWQGPKGGQSGANPVPDSNFVDDHLERLIEDGNSREARAHLNDMLQLAREMNDKQAMANYRKYEKRIAGMGMRGLR